LESTIFTPLPFTAPVFLAESVADSGEDLSDLRQFFHHAAPWKD
jgi:hypothetical protein